MNIHDLLMNNIDIIYTVSSNIKNKRAFAIFICESSPFQIGR